MGEFDKISNRLQCLELAVKVGSFNDTGNDVISNAEKYWQWINGNSDAQQAPTTPKMPPIGSEPVKY